MKAPIFVAFCLACLACLTCGTTFASAPASVANMLYLREDLLLGPSLGGASLRTLTFLRADGTYQELYSSLDRALSPIYYSIASGTYTYVVSSEDADTATITTSGEPASIRFTSSLSGTSEDSYRTFTFFPATTPSGAVNVSHRSWVKAGHVATAGFVIAGTGSRWVLLRAVGPSLTQYDVPTVVAAPTMKLFRAPSSSPRNEFGSWSASPTLSTQYSTIAAFAGAFPLDENSADSVGFVLLPPGAYTLQSGGATTEAEVLLEAYILPYGS